jgi:hypothetical protein
MGLGGIGGLTDFEWAVVAVCVAFIGQLVAIAVVVIVDRVKDRRAGRSPRPWLT